MDDSKERKKKAKNEQSEARHRARLDAYKRAEEGIAEKMAVERQKFEAEYRERVEALQHAEEKIAEKMATEGKKLEAEYHDRFEALQSAEEKVVTERQELEAERHHLNETIGAFNLRLAADDEMVRHEKLVELEGELRKLRRHNWRLTSMIGALHQTLISYPELDREFVAHLVEMLVKETKKLQKEHFSISKSNMKSTFIQIEGYLLDLVVQVDSILKVDIPPDLKKDFLKEEFEELKRILYGNIQYKFTPPLRSEREVQSEPAVVKGESVVNSNMTDAKLADVVGFFERSVTVTQQGMPEPLQEVQISVPEEGVGLKSEAPGM